MSRLKIVLAVAYVLMPLDFLPDFIPVLGWIDDLGVLGYAFWPANERATA